MRVDTSAQFTSPEMRFFLAGPHEAWAHPSVDMSSLPVVDIMGGQSAFVVTEENGRRSARAVQWNRPNLSSGSRVLRLATMEHTDGRDCLQREQLRALRSGAEQRPVVPADRLLLRVEYPVVQPRPALFEQTLHGNLLVLGGNARLPFLNGRPSGKDDEAARFQLLGVRSGRLLTSCLAMSGLATHRLVDWCVINSQLQNNLERQHLSDHLEACRGRLIELLNGSPDARLHLELSGQELGVSFIPEVEPSDRSAEFPALDADQQARVQAARVCMEACWRES